MTSGNGTPPAPPTPEEIADLRRLAAGIVRAQGNRFIKELLRSKGIRLGVNKDDFERNLTAAIESGELRIDDVDEWLKLVEGWGNQHVYLYNLAPAVRKDLKEATIRERVRDAGLEHVWNGATVLAFPDEPELTSISFADSVLRLVWQEASPGWTPVPEKDYRQEEGLDTFEYRAHRMVEQRAITRFEARPAEGLAALFVAEPIQGAEHRTAVDEARRVIGKLLDLRALERGQLDVSVVSRNLDQQALVDATKKSPPVKTQKSRLGSDGAYVEFASDSPDKAYWDVPAIRSVRKSVRTAQLQAFQGTDGVFVFQAGADGLTRPLRVQLYGRGDRIRLWKQMDAREVWAILTLLSTHQ